MPNFSGKWNLDGQLRGIKQGTWTGIPFDLPYGELYAIGDNSPNGNLGLNDVVDRSSPVQIGDLTAWSSVSISTNSGPFSGAIKEDGTLWMWGKNSSGQLGLNDTVYRSSPTQVGSLTNWSKVSARGSVHCIAIKTDGTLWAWGAAGSGKIGDNGPDVDKSSPIQIGSDTDWAQISASDNASRAIRTDGTLWGWGQRTGDGTNVNRSSPVQIGAETWSQVSGGQAQALAITTTGELYAWGFANAGRLGTGDDPDIDRSSPVQVGALTTWAQTSSGGSSGGAVKTDGTMWIWGAGTAGKLGNGTAYINQSSPVQIGSLTTWSAISVGINHCLALKTDGTSWSWGSDGNGQLGQGIRQSKSSPVQIGSETNWAEVDAGNNFSLLRTVGQGRTGMS